MTTRTLGPSPLPDLSSAVLRSPRLASLPWLTHGITSRVDSAIPGHGNVGYGPPRDPGAAWLTRQAWCRALDVDPFRLVAIRQVHGNDVLLVDTSHAGSGGPPGAPLVGDADALITCTPGLPLMTLHADCQPILFADTRRGAVGVAHAGWRGAVTDIAGATVSAMKTAFGSDPQDIWAFLGPAIGVECYEVGEEVIDAWEDAMGTATSSQAVLRGKPRPHFDLTVANRSLLERAGVRPEHIEEVATCTKCRRHSSFSHRGQGPSTGRFAAMIATEKASR